MANTQIQPVPKWKTILVILMLLFLFPVGVLLMFLWMRWPLWVKLVLSVGIMGLMLILIPILAAVVVIAINPLELTRRGRDAARLSDLANIQDRMIIAQKQSTGQNWLCSDQISPCEGKTTDPGASQLDGNGWVKVNFTKLGISMPVYETENQPDGLFIDPVNSDIYFYRYCSDGKEWELDAKLESSKFIDKAQIDDGDDGVLYEVGTDLKLCK